MNWVPWDDAIVVSAGKLRKLWDSLSELRSSVCERRLERTVLKPGLLPVKTAQFTQFFRQVWSRTVKSLRLTESVQGALPDANVHMVPQTRSRPLPSSSLLTDYPVTGSHLSFSQNTNAAQHNGVWFVYTIFRNKSRVPGGQWTVDSANCRAPQ
jgi:hypothetical protein